MIRNPRLSKAEREREASIDWDRLEPPDFAGMSEGELAEVRKGLLSVKPESQIADADYVRLIMNLISKRAITYVFHPRPGRKVMMHGVINPAWAHLLSQ